MIYVFTLILGAMLIALSITDIRSFRLPDLFTLPLIALGLIQSSFFPSSIISTDPIFRLPGNLVGSIIGCCVGYTSFLLIEAAYKYIRGKDGLGRGDAKLLAAGGAWCGWMGLPFIVLIASTAGLCALILPSFRKQADTGHIPFGPFLAFAVFMVWSANLWVVAGL